MAPLRRRRRPTETPKAVHPDGLRRSWTAVVWRWRGTPTSRSPRSPVRFARPQRTSCRRPPAGAPDATGSWRPQPRNAGRPARRAGQQHPGRRPATPGVTGAPGCSQATAWPRWTIARPSFSASPSERRSDVSPRRRLCAVAGRASARPARRARGRRSRGRGGGPRSRRPRRHRTPGRTPASAGRSRPRATASWIASGMLAADTLPTRSMLK